MIVDLFIPCFIDQLYPQTAMNVVKVLEKMGCGVSYNTAQTCCGQPAFNAGFWDHAKEVGEKFIKDFLGDRYIVTPSASCLSMVKNYYPELFHNTSLHNEYKQLQKNIFEFSDFIVNVLGKTETGARLDGIATYHDSCCALRECDIKEAPRKLLAGVKGLELREMEQTDSCCGFGGTFAVKHEAVSSSMAEQKVNHAAATGAEIIISTDMSCLMQIEGYLKKQERPMRVMHLADVLASGW